MSPTPWTSIPSPTKPRHISKNSRVILPNSKTENHLHRIISISKLKVLVKAPEWLAISVRSLSHVRLFATPWIAASQASLSITNSRISPKFMCHWWCHPAISSSVVPFSSCPQSLPASGSFPMSQLFASGGQSIGDSALASVLPVNTQDWFPSEWTGWISLQSKGLSRVVPNTTV